MLSKKLRLPIQNFVGKKGRFERSRYFLLKVFSAEYQFSRFDDVSYTGSGGSIYSLTSADLDGDGDIDIVIGTTSAGVFLYENKMPQKNKLER